MRREILPILILLALSVTAVADFRTIAEAHEVDLSNLRLPGNELGTVSFKLCSDCIAQVSRVNGNTRYAINDHAYPLSEFKKQLKLVRDPDKQNVSVLQHLESNTIQSIEVWIREAGKE